MSSVSPGKLIHDTADRLLLIYRGGTEKGLTNRIALLQMQAIMEDTPRPLAGLVFEAFLQRLEEAGITYDPAIFQEAVH